MTPEELDRALEEALKVEPGAGYAARVRARVAAEQASTVGHVWWPLGALAAAVLVLVAGGLALHHDDSPVLVATVTSHAGTIATDRTTQPGPQATGDEPRATEPPEAGVRRLRVEAAAANAISRSAGAVPPVLISPDDIAGLEMLATLPEAAFAASEIQDGEGQPPQISRIDVAPIEVDPLPQLTPVAIGELQ